MAVSVRTSAPPLSHRVISLLSGVLMSAIALGSIPSFEHTTEPTHDLQRTVQVEKADRQPVASTPLVDQSTVTSYLVREWNLGKQYATQVASAVLSAARRHGVDPLLLMAVAATESSFNHSVGNPGGGNDPMKPFGIMQVAGRYHQDKFPEGSVTRTNVGQNIDIGAQVIKEYLKLERGNERRALLRYNGSLHVSDKYFNKVNRFKKQVLSGLKEEKARLAEDDIS